MIRDVVLLVLAGYGAVSLVLDIRDHLRARRRRAMRVDPTRLL